MLLGSLFVIKSEAKDDNFFRVQIQIPDSHPVFDGHFPGAPVMPGVCQIQMLEETLSHLLKKSLVLKHANTIKFLAGMEPVKHHDITMEIKVEPRESDFHVNATYFNPSETFFKFKGDFHAA